MARRSKILETVLACALAGSAGAYAFQTAPDNSRANKVPGQTADEAMNKADRQLTQQIRKAIVSDKSLSTYAHNVKVMAQDGNVTLRGPVRDEDEKAAVEAKAKSIAGVSAVDNELTVAPKK